MLIALLFISKLKIVLQIFDVESWFDTSTYDGNDKRPLPRGKNKNVIGLLKDELEGKIMKEFCAPRAKTYSYLMDDIKIFDEIVG